MNRDDTFKITREDVWRELELLPVWKLRTPVEAVLTQQVAVEKLEAAQLAIIATEEPALKNSVSDKPAPENSGSMVAIQYEITMSQDKQWAFLCELGMPATHANITSQRILFNNILHALSIEKPSKMQVTSIADVNARVIVAMGEWIAQALLNTQEPLENLRGKLHAIGHTQLVASCDLAHLLNNPLDKAKVWQDLCLARSYLQGLHVQD